MEDIENALAARAVKLLEQIPKGQRLLVALAGSPGSGKSTLSKHILSKINALAGSDISQVVTQDGYHYYRYELETFPDQVEAFKRRGAPFTFNSEKLLKVVKDLREPVDAHQIISAPDFDHHLKDPQENAITVLPCHRIIIIEGNYVLLNDPYWSDIASLVDERWKLHVDCQEAKWRIAQRHVASGICDTLAEAQKRCEENDMVNAEYIGVNSCEPDLIIESISEKI